MTKALKDGLIGVSALGGRTAASRRVRAPQGGPDSSGCGGFLFFRLQHLARALISPCQFRLGIGLFKDLSEIVSGLGFGHRTPLAHSDAVAKAVAVVEGYGWGIRVAVDFAEAAGKDGAAAGVGVDG